jgi:hypothetical protein
MIIVEESKSLSLFSQVFERRLVFKHSENSNQLPSKSENSKPLVVVLNPEPVPFVYNSHNLLVFPFEIHITVILTSPFLVFKIASRVLVTIDGV